MNNLLARIQSIMAGKMIQKIKVPIDELMAKFNFWDPHGGKKN